jgi:hypothetical protein
MMRHVGILTTLLSLGWSTSGLAATEPCDRLFVPEGYELTCTVERKPGDDAWEVSVHPMEGAFAGLSELTLTPLDEDVDDPARWLREQVTIDVSGIENALTGFIDDEDNPFADESWWPSLQGLRDVVHSLSDLPLDSCDEPRERRDGSWSIDCEWGISSLRQFLTVRLVERDGAFYSLRTRSMNERRHRHLEAIANSF